MRIAIVCDPVDLESKTGISVYCEQLVKNLKKDQMHEYVFFHMRENPLFEGVEDIFFTSPTSLPIFSGLWMAWKKFFLIPREIRRRKIDLVHDFNTIGPHTFDFFRKYKVVTTIFDITPVLFKKHHSFINVFAFNLFVWRALRSSDAVIAISETTKNDVVKYYGISKDKVHVTLLWSKIQEIDSDEPNMFDFPYVLSVGTLEPRKNLNWLITAFGKLKESGKYGDVKLVLTGKIGWKIDSLIREYGLEEGGHAKDIIVTWFLSDSQLVSLYKHCSVFAYVSFYEGFGLPVLEAMALWAPVVTSVTSSMPEVAGDACLLVDPYDTDAISSALSSVLADEKMRHYLSQKWLERAKLFSWRKCAEETIQIYSEL